jgi:hypothetical protein
MSSSGQEHAIDPVAQSGREADAILINLRDLRDQIVTAWREKGVVLLPEEQAELRAEIKQTCQFLTDLTQGS